MRAGEMSEIARLEQKIDSFMESQKETNTRLSISIEKVADAVLQNQAQQVEINQLTNAFQKIDNKIDKMGARIGSVETNQAVTDEFRKEAKQLKWVSIGAIVSLMLVLFKNFIL